MLALSFLTLLALPVQAESPPCDCLDGPLLTGAPPCVEVGFAGCYLGAADTSLINQCGSEIVLVDFPVDDGLGGVCDAAPCVVAPGETAHFINSIGSYTVELDGEAYAVDMNLECEVGGGGGDTGDPGGDGDRGCATVGPGPATGALLPLLGLALAGARRRNARGLG